MPEPQLIAVEVGVLTQRTAPRQLRFVETAKVLLEGGRKIRLGAVSVHYGRHTSKSNPKLTKQ